MTTSLKMLQTKKYATAVWVALRQSRILKRELIPVVAPTGLNSVVR
jgi:hypothetical protein